MPLISVIIPAYNAEKTIKKTIESVLSQTFSDFELIIINDGSQDSTLDIVYSIQDSRIKVFSYPNSGQPASRNRGFAHSCGEYISFIDADDCWTADKLEAQFRALQDNPQAAVAYSWTNCIDESGQFLRRGSYITAQGDVYAKLLLIDFIESGSNPLICSQALAAVGSFDGSLTNVHDWDMWLRLAARYHFVCVPSPQILYRVSPNSMSSNVLGVEASSLRVIERAFAQAPESVRHLKRYSIANRYNGLTIKTLDGYPERQRGLTAARFIWNTVRYDPSLLGRGVIFKVLFKIAVMVLFPPGQAQALLTRFKQLSNTGTLYAYLRLNPF